VNEGEEEYQGKRDILALWELSSERMEAFSVGAYGVYSKRNV